VRLHILLVTSAIASRSSTTRPKTA